MIDFETPAGSAAAAAESFARSGRRGFKFWKKRFWNFQACSWCGQDRVPGAEEFICGHVRLAAKRPGILEDAAFFILAALSLGLLLVAMFAVGAWDRVTARWRSR